MGSRVDALILHDDGEDETLDLKPSRLSRACTLSDELVANSTLWSPKDKRLLDRRMARCSTKRPEFITGIPGKSKAQISERMAHLARVRPYFPRLPTWAYPKLDRTPEGIQFEAEEEEDMHSTAHGIRRLRSAAVVRRLEAPSSSGNGEEDDEAFEGTTSRKNERLTLPTPKDSLISPKAFRELLRHAKAQGWTPALDDMHKEALVALRRFVEQIMTQVLTVSSRTQRPTKRFNASHIGDTVANGAIQELRRTMRPRERPDLEE